MGDTQTHITLLCANERSRKKNNVKLASNVSLSRNQIYCIRCGVGVVVNATSEGRNEFERKQ